MCAERHTHETVGDDEVQRIMVEDFLGIFGRKASILLSPAARREWDASGSLLRTAGPALRRSVRFPDVGQSG